MSSLDRSKTRKTKRHRQFSSTKKVKTKMTYSIPDSLSEESSLDENYMEKYSTESEYSDSKQQNPDEFSSGEEFVEGKGGRVPLFSTGNDTEELSDLGAELIEERMNKYFAAFRKSEENPYSPDVNAGCSTLANGDFIWSHLRTKSSSCNQKPTVHQAITSSGIVRPPDPKSAPEIVLRLHNKEDVVKNRRVLDYLNQLEAAENDVNRRLEANVKVSAEEIKTLHEARDAILKQFGYDFRDEAKTKRYEDKARRRQKRKNAFPSGVSVSSSSETDDSERPLKEEIARRVLNAGQGNVAELSFADLMKHSPKWTACVEEELTRNDFKGKIENMTKLIDKFRGKKKNL